jgi:hypothetical protein
MAVPIVAIAQGVDQIAGGIAGGASLSKASRKQRELAERLAGQEREDYQKQFAGEQEQARIENEKKAKEMALRQTAMQTQQGNETQGLNTSAMATLARGKAEALKNSQSVQR